MKDIRDFSDSELEAMKTRMEKELILTLLECRDVLRSAATGEKVEPERADSALQWVEECLIKFGR